MGEENKEVVLVDVTTKVPKETYEVGKAGGKFMAVLGEALKNGWQWSDVSTIVQGIWTEAAEAADDITDVVGEFDAVPFKAGLGIIIPVTEGAEIMLEKLKNKEEIVE